MYRFGARLRATSTALLILALATGLSATNARAADPPTEDEILKAKCTLCHDSRRVVHLKVDEVRPVLERMRKMNPDWITVADSDHIVEVIAKIIADPKAVAEREAWVDALDRGKQVFNDPGLGTTGKSCASCHAPAIFKNAVAAFPKWHPGLKRFVDIQEWVNLMVTDQMKGTALAPSDRRYVDLLIYLKSR